MKDSKSVQIAVNFDEDTGRSTEVDASSLWAESESTTRTREAQERQMGTAVPSEQRSRMNADADMDRRTQSDLDR